MRKKKLCIYIYKYRKVKKKIFKDKKYKSKKQYKKLPKNYNGPIIQNMQNIIT